MKTKRKYRTLGLVEPKRLSSFDWKKAITIISPDERLDTGTGLPPVRNQSKNEGKIYAKAITILWHEGNGKYNDVVFDSGKSLFEAFEAIYRYEIDNILEMGEDPLDMAYSKMKLKVLFMDGEQDEFRADISPVEFNPYNFRSLHEFVVAAYGSAIDPNYVYNFMGFVNPNYQNEPKWKPNPEAVARKKAEDEKKANSFRFEGANYRKTADLSREELIKVIREAFAEKYPYAKLSVRQDNRGTGTGSIDVKILDIGFNPFNDEFKSWLKEGNTNYSTWDRDDYNRIKSYYTPKALKVRDDMRTILSSYNFDDSDSQSDYFHRRFYGDVEMEQGNHLKLYMPETAMAQGIFKDEANTKEWEAKRKAKREERKKDFVYSYGDVVVYTVNWRGTGGKDEYCLISKVPNGESRFSLDYDVWVLREAKTPEALKKAMNDEAELKQSRYQKSKRKKFIGVVYINGTPYIKYQYLENVRMSSIKPIEGTYTHWLKEEQAAKNAPKPPKPEPKPKPVKTETAKAPTVAKATLPSSTSNADVEISRNLAKNGIEVKFKKFPSDADRDFVKSKGLKWSSFSKVWYATYSERLFTEIQEYFKGSPAEIPKPEPNKALALKVAIAKAKIAIALAVK